LGEGSVAAEGGAAEDGDFFHERSAGWVLIQGEDDTMQASTGSSADRRCRGHVNGRRGILRGRPFRFLQAGRWPS
jgi:hypothetical protein